MIPPLPEIRLVMVEDLSKKADGGFLRLVRRRLIAHYPDGSQSEAFVYDEIDRDSIDAVVVVAHYADAHGGRSVYLRSAVRPPLIFRDRKRSPVPELDPRHSIWELPAGLVDRAEQVPGGPRASAARELAEELGFFVTPEQMKELGPSVFPTPGVIAERHFFFSVEVVPEARKEPELDGSALEHGGIVTAVSLSEALRLCREGGIVDAKTELGLRRIADQYA